jgi:hypothetical protein
MLKALEGRLTVSLDTHGLSIWLCISADSYSVTYLVSTEMTLSIVGVLDNTPPASMFVTTVLDPDKFLSGSLLSCAVAIHSVVFMTDLGGLDGLRDQRLLEFDEDPVYLVDSSTDIQERVIDTIVTTAMSVSMVNHI